MCLVCCTLHAVMRLKCWYMLITAERFASLQKGRILIGFFPLAGILSPLWIWIVDWSWRPLLCMPGMLNTTPRHIYFFLTLHSDFPGCFVLWWILSLSFLVFSALSSFPFFSLLLFLFLICASLPIHIFCCCMFFITDTCFSAWTAFCSCDHEDKGPQDYCPYFCVW
jgi:hypothetical protein